MGLLRKHKEIKKKVEEVEQEADEKRDSSTSDELLEETDDLLDKIEEVLEGPDCITAPQIQGDSTCPCGVPFDACPTWVADGLYRYHEGDIANEILY